MTGVWEEQRAGMCFFRDRFERGRGGEFQRALRVECRCGRCGRLEQTADHDDDDDDEVQKIRTGYRGDGRYR